MRQRAVPLSLAMAEPADWIAFDGRIAAVVWGRATYTLMPLPPEVERALHGVRRVEGEMNEHPVNLALARAPVVDGVFLWTGQSLLDRIGLTPGEAVSVRLRPAPDDVVETPPDLGSALLDAGARPLWDALTPGKRRGLLYQLDSARTAPTRARRIAALVQSLLSPPAPKRR